MRAERLLTSGLRVLEISGFTKIFHLKTFLKTVWWLLEADTDDCVTGGPNVYIVSCACSSYSDSVV